MTKSALQIARAAYQPKLPKALKGAVKAVAGAATRLLSITQEGKVSEEGLGPPDLAFAFLPI